MTVLLIHVMATWFMVGLIWFVQVVHYPLMNRVGSTDYVTYQEDHMRQTTWVVGPGMLVEVLTGIWLLYEGASMMLWVSFVLLVLIWASTVLLQVPRHNKLLQIFDTGNHIALVQTNWIRTIAWTVRGLLGFWMLKIV